MTTTKLQDLAALGQSIWLDYISRSLMDDGGLSEWIAKGLRGLTSNPSIFNQVISRTQDYDRQIFALKKAGESTFNIYDELTAADVRKAADLFSPVYKETEGLDGYVSLEINPELAQDTETSIREGKRLAQKVGRPNLMIKVPATPEGFPVITELLAEGINVNATLIFSMEQYAAAVEAYGSGLEKLADRSGDLSQVRSVASVFVSRIDTLVDKLIDEQAPSVAGGEEQQHWLSLKGRAATANCRLILEKSRELFSGERFMYLRGKGAAPQRVLWGSTSTKNPHYSDIKYVSDLIAPDTVNTVPEQTLLAFCDHGTVQPGLTQDVREAQGTLEALERHGISVPLVCHQLLEDGVAAFDKAFKELLQAIETKARQLCPPSG